VKAYILIDPLNCVPAFPLRRIAGAAALGGLEILHDQQQSEIVLLAPNQNGTKQGRRCSCWSVSHSV